MSITGFRVSIRIRIHSFPIIKSKISHLPIPDISAALHWMAVFHCHKLLQCALFLIQCVLRSVPKSSATEHRIKLDASAPLPSHRPPSNHRRQSGCRLPLPSHLLLLLQSHLHLLLPSHPPLQFQWRQVLRLEDASI